MPTIYKFDVFISYSSKDRELVLPIAERLRSDRLRVWFDKWEIRPGAHINAKIEAGLNTSRRLVFFMSANAFGSSWTKLESSAYRFRDPLNEDLAFLPVRLDEAPIEGTLAQFEYIDFVHDPEEGYARLLEACRLEGPDLRPLDPEGYKLENERGSFFAGVGLLARRAWSRKISVATIVLALALVVAIGAAFGLRLRLGKPRAAGQFDDQKSTGSPESPGNQPISSPPAPEGSEDGTKTVDRAFAIVDDDSARAMIDANFSLPPTPYFHVLNTGGRAATQVVLWYNYKLLPGLDRATLEAEMTGLSRIPLARISGKITDAHGAIFDVRGSVPNPGWLIANARRADWVAGQISLYVWGRICYQEEDPSDPAKITGWHVTNFCLRSDGPYTRKLIACDGRTGNGEADATYATYCP